MVGTTVGVSVGAIVVGEGVVGAIVVGVSVGVRVGDLVVGAIVVGE